MKIKTLKSFTGSFIAAIILLGLASCGQKKAAENTEANGEEFEQAEAEVKDQIEAVVYDIPSPSEIPFLLEATGADYNESLLNDISKVETYEITNDVAALNLGIYATDMGYLISYGKVQEALNYLSSTKNLADHLGVTTSVNVALLERFEANLDNRDSLAYILDDAIGETDDFLQDDNRNRVAALMISGSFVEGLYVSTALINTYPKDLLPDDARNIVLTPLIRVILNQEKALNDLLALLATIDQANPVGDIKTDLMELKGLYEALDIHKQIEDSRPDLVITDATLIDITKKVSEIRNKIIE